jgi:hypothetical protein
MDLLEGAQFLDLLLLVLEVVSSTECGLQPTETVQRRSVLFEGTVGCRKREVFDVD